MSTVVIRIKRQDVHGPIAHCYNNNGHWDAFLGEMPMHDHLELSDHCLIDHREAFSLGVPKPSLTRRAFLLADRKIYFTGLRGRLWRLLGIDRALKNPNICNV